MFDTVDFGTCQVLYREESEPHKEDLLQLRCPSGRLIDVGWYGEEGQYTVLVVQDGCWDPPCYQAGGFARLEDAEHWLGKIIWFETRALPENVEEGFRRVTEVLDRGGRLEEAIPPLAALRDLGVGQNEAADFLLVHALRYRESREENWDLACDLLDRITGWCAPELRLWGSGTEEQE